ncbi:TPA: CdiA family toxin C-terminal domain-containing protein [Pseudomonas aeruginosa]
MATSPEFRQQFGDSYLKGLEERAAFLTQAYEDAGWQGSVTAGVEGGSFAAELVGVLTAVKGGAQITAKLPTAAKNLVNAIAESPVSGSMSSQLGAVGDLGRLGGGAKGTANFPEGMSFNPNIKNHLSNFDGLTQKSGISGTHNLDAFNQAATTNGVKVLSETPTSIAGITTVRYQIPAYDRAGNIVGFKDKIFPKTVYDPKIFTDQGILDLGQQAAAGGYKDALSKGLSQYDSVAGGITFRVYLDKFTGTVTNFHPK